MMYSVQTFMGGYYEEFDSLYEAKRYKMELVKEYGYDPDYVEIYKGTKQIGGNGYEY